MPLKVKRFCTSVFIALLSITISANAQTPQPSPAASPSAGTVPAAEPLPVRTPTAAEIMRERIGKAKAFIAVRNYASAIYELENIRRETNDPSVSAVTNVLLMNTYLEQGNYRKAREFLDQNYKSFKAKNAGADVLYPAIAGQVIKGARNQIDRYRALGLTVSDRNLPLEAVSDIEQMRETLELVVTQAKEISAEKERMPVAMPLLEEATAARSSMARDDYDARRWRDEVGDTREQIANSRSVILSAVVDPGTAAQATNTSASMPAPVTPAPAVQPPAAAESKGNGTTARPAETAAASAAKPAPAESKRSEPAPERPVRIVASAPRTEEPKPAMETEAARAEGPMEVGSLVAFAVSKQAPRYPPTARQMRATGVVRVEIVVDEDGNVAEIQKTAGHSLLQPAAREAIEKWKFKPFTRDGQPVRASGFINFNFSL